MIAALASLEFPAEKLEKFEEFLRLNMRLAPTTVQTNLIDVRRFLEQSGGIISYETITEYLKGYLEKAPKTYNRNITSLRRFVRDFLRQEELIASFKIAPADVVPKTDVPTKNRVRDGFWAQRDTGAKALYLFTATTGLRKCEILDLTKDNIDPELRAVIPEHFTRKKRGGVTFYNSEVGVWLNKYLAARNSDDDPRVFVLSDRQWRKIWRRAGLTSKQLRAWFATEMGELRVPDRFVDIFQGRAARSVLAKHYTGKGLERLKRIYDTANLRVLS